MATSELISEDMDTTIRVSLETKDELVELGRKNESYDTILKRLIRFWQDNPESVRLWQENKGIEDLRFSYATASPASPREPGMAKPKVPKEPHREKKTKDSNY